MAAIEKPASGETIDASWGTSVANAINRIGVGLLHGSNNDSVVGAGGSCILPITAVEADSRLFWHPEDGSIIVSEGRRGIYVVTAYLAIKGLADNEWGRAYLYRNGVSFAGNSVTGAGGTGIPLCVAGIDLFEEGDSLQVRVSFQSDATVRIESLSMTRIAENT